MADPVRPADTLQLTVNGQRRRLPAPLSVAALVDALGLVARQVAVERNRKLVPRADFADTWLRDGDAVEIVTFFGGG